METKNSDFISPPPRLMPTIMAGFNAVANHIWLIIFPVLLDLFIWFGPKLRLQTVFAPVIEEANRTLTAAGGSEMAQILASAQEAWAILIKRINLTNSISTFPLGIPSLVAATDTQATPLGQSPTFEIPSLWIAFTIFVGLVLLGLFLGTLYINFIARKTSPEQNPFAFSSFIRQVVNIYALVMVILFAIMLVLIPALFIISIVALFSPALSQIVFLIITFILLWLLIPFLFSPHGIFIQQLNVFKSVMASIRLVRFFLPTTGLFILVFVLMAQGLDYLWLAPPSNSWLLVIGITGHAFIYTSLIAASFIYYQQGTEWMSANLSKLNQLLKV